MLVLASGVSDSLGVAQKCLLNTLCRRATGAVSGAEDRKAQEPEGCAKELKRARVLSGGRGIA